MIFAKPLDGNMGSQSGPARRSDFYGAIALFTIVGIAMNFLGINLMRTLVVAGIVQGFSTPPLMLLIMLMTNNREIMGDRTNNRAMNILGWTTTATIFAASTALVLTWII
jgi:Mn2+/Fe2+ NRAMP family transporter